MYFDIKSFSIKRNGRFAKCWLAATCPKQFRKFVKRAEVDNIQVTNLCDNILQNVCGTSRQASTDGRLSLHTAAQLTFGAVCIHQQQVHFLYEQISNLMAVRTFLVFDPIKRKRNSNNNYVRAKRPRVASLASVVSSMICDFHESVINSEAIDMDHCDQLCAPIEAVTLRETISEHLGGAEVEGFGVMTEEERMEFMYGDLSVEERRRLNDQEAGMLIVMAEIHNPPSPENPLMAMDEEILCSQRTANGDAGTPVYSYRSAAIVNSNIIPDIDIQEIDVETKQPPVENDVLNETIISLSQTSLANQINNIPTGRRPTKLKKRKLLVDPVKTISVSCFNDPDRYRSSRRTWCGLDEAVEHSDIYQHLQNISQLIPTTHSLSVGRKSFKQLIITDGKAQMSTVLFDQYRSRASKRYTEALDEQWVLSVCGEMPSMQRSKALVEQRPIVQRIFLRSHSTLFSTNPTEADQQPHPSTAETPIQTLNGYDESQQLSSCLEPYVAQPNSTLSNSRSTKELADICPPFTDIDHQMEYFLQSLHLEEEPMIENDTIPINSTYYGTNRELHNEWGKKGLLEKLINLWRLNVQPINMASVTRSAKCDRRAAAFVFYTLMELHKLELVVLHKQDGSSVIRHIEMTPKLADSLKLLGI